MKKYKIAAVLMIIHGGFMEIGWFFAMIPALIIGTDKGEYFEFKLRNGNHKVDLNTLNNDVISMRNTLYDFMGVVDKK